MGRDLFGEIMGVSQEEKKEDKRVRNRRLRENVPSDIGSRSKDLQIVSQLVDTSRRSVGVDKSAGKRVFVKRPVTVGYRVKNVSDEAVTFNRRVYRASAPSADGEIVYTCSDAEYVLEAGKSVDLSKYDAARLFGRTEFGFTARNGYFTGSKGLENSADLEEYYSTRYFVPTTPLSDRDTVIINSEVGLKDVSDEFLPVFAFLMQSKKPKRQKVSSRCQIESLALAEYLKNNEAPLAVEASSGAFDAEGLESIVADLEEAAEEELEEEVVDDEVFPEEDYEGGDGDGYGEE
jgi:hypothetical protein